MKYFLKTIAAVLAVLLLVSLSACGKNEAVPQKPQAAQEPQPSPEPAPEPTPEPTPEPVSVFDEDPGVPVIVNGCSVETLTFSGISYVLFDSFMEAAGLEHSLVEEGAVFRLHGAQYAIEYQSCELRLSGEPVALDAAPIYEFGHLYLPVSAFSKAAGIPEFLDEENGTCYYTPAGAVFDIPEGKQVPVLMYHSVSDNMWGISELFVSPTSMEEQLAYLNENGYTTLFFEDLWNIENIEKPVILTFDDGYTDNYENLFPLLQKYNCKATIFCISGWMGDADGLYINYERAREMADSGLVSIQSHGFSHQKLGAVPEDVISNELSLSKLMLTRITGREPYVIGYPHGSYSARSVQLAAEYYNFGVLMDGGVWNTSDDPHMIRRYYVSRYTDLNTFASYCGG